MWYLELLSLGPIFEDSLTPFAAGKQILCREGFIFVPWGQTGSLRAGEAVWSMPVVHAQGSHLVWAGTLATGRLWDTWGGQERGQDDSTGRIVHDKRSPLDLSHHGQVYTFRNSYCKMMKTVVVTSTLRHRMGNTSTTKKWKMET